VRGDHRSYLGDQVVRRSRKRWIAAAGHPAGAQHHRLDLVGRQHQRRHVEAALEHVAYARLTANRHALGDQLGDVSIDRPQGGLEFVGHRLGGNRRPGPAEDLDDGEQPLGASHGGHNEASVLTAA
jgi:hypothetical protein